MLALYGEPVPRVDLQIARRWAQLSAALGNDSADPMISASALEHPMQPLPANAAASKPRRSARVTPKSEAR